jgi:GT2 family glycosyltransferase
MEQDQPLVSVIIPAFNVAAWIGETIQSVLRQSYRPIEVIVVDDGSTDDTALVAGKFGNALTYLRQPNAGVGAARNTGFKASRGDLIAFVDADDLWLPGKLEEQVALLKSKPEFGWVYTDAFIVDHTAGKVLDRVGRTHSLPDGDIAGSLLLNNFIACPTPLIRRSLLARVGGFDERRSLTVAADWLMWLRLAVDSPAGCVRTVLASVRSHPASMTGTMDLQATYDGKVAVIDQVVALRPRDLTPLRSRAVSNVQIGMGQWMVRRGDMARARSMFRAAVREDPTNTKATLHFLGSLLPRGILELTLKIRKAFVLSLVRARRVAP